MGVSMAGADANIQKSGSADGQYVMPIFFLANIYSNFFPSFDKTLKI